MMTRCLSTMAEFGPGWTLVSTLIAATAALTYFVNRRADAQSERTTSNDRGTV